MWTASLKRDEAGLESGIDDESNVSVGGKLMEASQQADPAEMRRWSGGYFDLSRGVSV